MSAALKPSILQASAQAFLARFEGLRARLPGDVAVRDAAAEMLRNAGLPGAREEAWRYEIERRGRVKKKHFEMKNTFVNIVIPTYKDQLLIKLKVLEISAISCFT